jgi:hypothetical protein
VVVAGVLAASGFAGVTPATAAWTTMARWEMNEPAGATVMEDSSEKDRDGAIGSVVETGVPLGGGDIGYEWPAGDLSVQDPGRLVEVPGRGFNPRGDRFSVTVRFATGAVDQNIIQKGQAQTAGGMWRIDMTATGKVVCLFRGAGGQAAIGSTPGVSLADNTLHTVRCIRRAGSVTIVVDGGEPRTNEKASGRIANTQPVTIGGKLQCNPANDVSCQYFVGEMDRAIIKRKPA